MNIEDVISEDTPEYIALDEFEKYLIIYRIIYLQMMEIWNKPMKRYDHYKRIVQLVFGLDEFDEGIPTFIESFKDQYSYGIEKYKKDTIQNRFNYLIHLSEVSKAEVDRFVRSEEIDECKRKILGRFGWEPKSSYATWDNELRRIYDRYREEMTAMIDKKSHSDIKYLRERLRELIKRKSK